MFDLKQFVPVAMAVGVFLSGAAYAGAAEQGERVVSLSFSDGRPDAVGLAAVNEHLGKVGVRISEVPGAKQALPILEASKSRALDEAEHKELLSIFSLDRDGLLDEIRKAGRKPAVDGGGALSISEKDVPPYPKIYDMKALDSDTVTFLKKKFGRLHVNSANSGHGIDEVMTIVSGGPYTWFFVLQDNAVAKVKFSAVGAGQPAWRISYPGLFLTADISTRSMGWSLPMPMVRQPSSCDMKRLALPEPKPLTTIPGSISRSILRRSSKRRRARATDPFRPDASAVTKPGVQPKHQASAPVLSSRNFARKSRKTLSLSGM